MAELFFNLEDGGKRWITPVDGNTVKTGLSVTDFTGVIIREDDGASLGIGVSLSTEQADVFYYDWPTAWATQTGWYGVRVVVDKSAPGKFTAVLTDNVYVSEKLWDDIAIDASGVSIDASGIATEVWDRQLSGHQVVGSAGRTLSDLTSGGSIDPTAVSAAVWDIASNNYNDPGTMGFLQNLIFGTGALPVCPGTGEIAAAVDALQTVIHGAGSWQTAVAADFPGTGLIAEAVDTTLTATHGAGSWQSATASIDPTAVAAAVWGASGASYLVSGTTGRYLALVLYRGAIYIDTGNGSSGTVVGVNGTPGNPVDNLADAVSLAAGTGLRHYRIRKTSGGPLTLTSSHDDWRFEGIGGEVTIALAGEDVDGSRFDQVEISGTQNGTIHAHDCELDGVGDLLGVYQHCRFLNGSSLAVGTSSFEDCVSAVPGTGRPTLDFVGAGRSANFRRYAGGLELQNLTDVSNVVTLEMMPGAPNLAASCTGGTVDLRGEGKPLVDNSGGTTVISTGYLNTVAIDGELTTSHGSGSWQSATATIDPTAVGAAVWDVAAASHVLPGSMGSQANLIAGTAAIAGAVDTVLSSTHGAGSWLSATATIDPTAVAAAVWDAQSVNYIDPGSMGLLQGQIAGTATILGTAEIAAAVDSQLTAQHGDGSWQTATGIPGTAQIADAVDDTLTAAHGVGSWQSATASIDPTAVSAAVWDAPRASYALVGSFGEYVNVDTVAIRTAIMSYVIDGNSLGLTHEESLDMIRKLLKNKLSLTDGDSGNWVLYDDDGTSTFLTFDVTDKLGGSIVQPPGAPSDRSAGT